MDIDKKDIEELLELTRQNNVMLKFIVDYINNININSDNENFNDFVRNVIANMITNKRNV